MTYHLKQNGQWLIAATVMLPKRRAHMGLQGNETGWPEVDTLNRDESAYGDQARGTTSDHIGVLAVNKPGTDAPVISEVET